ncbi:MAG: hypothetical protein ACOX0X_01470 [Candidatus Dojkabacteria bacterium]|jgi:hypothetical protein
MTNNKVDTKKYLITEAVDIKNISQQKIEEDLKLLEKQEQRVSAKTDISRGSSNIKLTRVMKALQLSNPFKGY